MGGHVDPRFVGQRWESSITGPDMIRDTSEKVNLIWKHLFMAQSRQKRYDDK